MRSGKKGSEALGSPSRIHTLWKGGDGLFVVLVVVAVVVLGDVAHGLLQALDDDAVLLGVVHSAAWMASSARSEQCTFTGGSPSRASMTALFVTLRLLHRLALHEHGRHRARGDGGAAAEGLELHVGDDAILDLRYIFIISPQVGLPTSPTRRVRYFSHVSRISE